MFTPVAASLSRTRVTPRYGLIAVALLALSAAPAMSADERLKDLLGRAQQQLDGKAVEDLVGKLEGSRPSPSGPKPPEAKAPDVKPAQANGPAIHQSVPDADQPSGRASLPTVPTPPSNLAVPAVSPPAEPATATATATPPTVPTAPAPVVAPAKSATIGIAESVPQAPLATKTTSASPEVQSNSAKGSRLPSVDLEITFEFNSAEISPTALPTLALLGRALSDPRLAAATFLIGGHTDAKGRTDYNRHLSQLRADAVRAFLISSYAIAPIRLTAKGFGESRLKNRGNPLADENRRVQITNTSKLASR